MAKVNDRAIPWFAVRALERSAGGRYSAGDIYPDLDAEPGAQRRVLIGHAVAHHAAKVCDFGINPLPPLLRAPLCTRFSSIQVRINIGGRISTTYRPLQRSSGEPGELSI